MVRWKSLFIFLMAMMFIVYEHQVFAEQNGALGRCILMPYKPYKSIDSALVYYISSDCTKRSIRNPEVYFSHFDSWSESRVVSSETLNQIPNHPLSFLPWGRKRNLGNGALVKTVDDPRVYLKLGQSLYPIGSATLFVQLGYEWHWVEDVLTDVITVHRQERPIATIADYPTGLAFKYGDSPTVYTLERNQTGAVAKRPISTLAELRTRYRVDRVAVLSRAQAFADATGSATPPASTGQASNGGGGGGQSSASGSTNQSQTQSGQGAQGQSSQGQSGSTTNQQTSGGQTNQTGSGFTSGSGSVTQPSTQGQQPPAAAGDIVTFDIRNDLNISRQNELAFSGIPLAQSRGLTNTDRLAVFDARGNRVEAQFRVLSRWGGAVAEMSRPIRWLEVALVTDAPANSVVYYALRQTDAAVVRGSNLVSGSGKQLTVNTGPAVFKLNGDLSGIFENIEIGNRRVYTNSAAAGPRLIDSGATVGATVDQNGFVLEENGPVKVVVRSSGHFTRSTANCLHPLGYDMRLTFTRGSANVTMEFDVRNECGNGYNLDWQANRHVVDEIIWQLPLQLDAGSKRSIIATENAMYTSNAGYNGATEIEQQIGSSGVSNWRRARATRGATTVAAASAFAKPFLALVDQNISLGITMPWMQWREPQALAANDTTLIIKFTSEESGIGEAQTRWHFAQLRFFSGNPTDATIAAERDRAVAVVERGLLVHTPVAYLNATHVIPRLPEGLSSALVKQYSNIMNTVHADTVPRQWLNNKTFGIFWPDIPVISFANQTPAEFNLGSNYWSPTLNEVLEFYRTGDPKWYWDFVFPAEQTFNKTNVYNLATRYDGTDTRSGFGVGKGDTAPAGAPYRQILSSDDYLYNQGSDESYVLRPSKSIQSVFTRGCQTFIERYSRPRNQGGEFVSRMEIIRQVSQHVNALRYGAEFTEDPTQAVVCNNKLRAVMQEYAEDNFKGGIFCIADSGNETSCETDDSFMYGGIHLDVFLGYLYNYGDHTVQAAGRTLTNVIRNAIVGTARQYYQTVVARSGVEINPRGDWFNALRCSFSNGGTSVASCSGQRFTENIYELHHTMPMTLSTMLVAHELNPSVNLCGPVGRALLPAVSQGSEFFTFFDQETGWTKGPSQIMKLVAYGVGIAETCGAVGSTTQQVPPSQTQQGQTQQNQTQTTQTQQTTDQSTNQSQATSTGSGGTVGLPTTTHTLGSGEAVEFDSPEPQYGHLMLGHTIGRPGTEGGATSQCYGDDFVRYDVYLKAGGASQYTLIGNHGAGGNANWAGGHTMDSGGCAKGAFFYTFNVPAGTHEAAACITNTKNTSQRYCVTRSFTK